MLWNTMVHRFRFFVDGTHALGDIVTLAVADVQHLRVIRAGAGETVEVVDNAGVVFEARIIEAGDVELVSVVERLRDDFPDIVLYAGFLPGQRWDVLVDAAVQAGASTIVPVVQSTREQTQMQRRAPRMDRIVEAAAKQAKRVRLPVVTEPIRLRDLPHDLQGIVLDERSSVPFVDVDVAACVQPGADTSDRSTLALLVGPAAGLPEDTTDALEIGGWVGASLGPTVLRSELAVAVAISTAFQLLQSASRP